MKAIKRFWSLRNLWITLLLVGANLAAWMSGSSATWPEAKPELDPQISALIDLYTSGEASGQAIHLELTDESLSNMLAWYLERNPSLPFSRPNVVVTSQAVTGRAYITLLGLRTPVQVSLNVWVENGRLGFKILGIKAAGAPLPASAIAAIQAQIEPRLEMLKNLAIEITWVGLSDGKLVIDGKMK